MAMTNKLDLSQVNFQSDRKIKYRKPQKLTEVECESWWQRIHELRRKVSHRLIGQKDMLDCLLMGLLTGGHVLLHGEPGLGKSTAIQALCDQLHCKLAMVQKSQDFIGANLVIVDELERSDKSFRRALLTAMQEKEVVIGKQQFYLDLPFVVFCTINPSENGQLPLLQAELDRFMLHYRVPAPDLNEELAILAQHLNQSEVYDKSVDHILNAKDLLDLQRLVLNIHISAELRSKMVRTMAWVRTQKFSSNWSGFSPRTTIYWAYAACAKAFLDGRTAVKSEDLNYVMQAVFSHRLPRSLQITQPCSEFMQSLKDHFNS